MWKKIGHQSVRGLREIGFIEDTDFLIVLGYGRTIFNCQTNEKIARDKQDYYVSTDLCSLAYFTAYLAVNQLAAY